MGTDNSTLRAANLPPQNKKPCPLRYPNPNVVGCVEEGCAWWMCDSCAVAVIAANISDMRDTGLLMYQP